MPNPNRGEVWLVDLGYVAKTRPCLVLSIPAEDADRALATLVPHTTSVRGSRFEVKIKVRYLKEGAFDAQNLVTIPHGKADSQIRFASGDGTRFSGRCHPIMAVFMKRLF